VSGTVFRRDGGRGGALSTQYSVFGTASRDAGWATPGNGAPAAAESAFARFRAMFSLRIPTESVFRILFELRSRCSLTHWVGMLLAAYKESDATALYSEDLSADETCDGISIVDPSA